VGWLDTLRSLAPVTRGRVDELAAENMVLRARISAAQNRNGVASGVPMGSRGEFDYEFNELLTGTKGVATLELMEADPHIKGALRSNMLPLLSADWEYKAASDKPRDKEVAEFCNANLLRRNSDQFGCEFWCQTSWEGQRLVEILQMLLYGYSVFHKSTRTVGTKRVFDRIQWLEPITIDGSEPWKLDDFDNIVGVNRRLTTPNQVFKFDEFVPADKMALYAWDMRGARYGGRPFVRSMYGAWLRKDTKLRAGTIWASKAGAPMPMGSYPENWTKPVIAAFETAVKASRGTAMAEAFFVGPKSADGNKAEINFAGADLDVERGMTQLIEMENQEISHAAATGSEMLGETKTGSRAVGDTQQSRERQQIEAVARCVAEIEMHGIANLPGLRDELIAMNYADVKEGPELQFSGLTPNEELENFGEIVKAWTAGIIPKTEESRKQIVQRLGIELPDEAFEIEEPPPLPATVPPQSTRPVDSTQDPPTEQPASIAAAASDIDAFRSRIQGLLKPSREGAPGNGGRFPDRAGGEFYRPGRGTGDVSGRRTGRAGGAT